MAPSLRVAARNPAILCCRPWRWTRHSLRPPPRLAGFSQATPAIPLCRYTLGSLTTEIFSTEEPWGEVCPKSPSPRRASPRNHAPEPHDYSCDRMKGISHAKGVSRERDNGRSPGLQAGDTEDLNSFRPSGPDNFMQSQHQWIRISPEPVSMRTVGPPPLMSPCT
jgi:hypothetical protein